MTGAAIGRGVSKIWKLRVGWACEWLCLQAIQVLRYQLAPVREAQSKLLHAPIDRPWSAAQVNTAHSLERSNVNCSHSPLTRKLALSSVSLRAITRLMSHSHFVSWLPITSDCFNVLCFLQTRKFHSRNFDTHPTDTSSVENDRNFLILRHSLSNAC